MSLLISDTSKVASSHATVATRPKGPLQDGKDLVGEMCFNLEPGELLSMFRMHNERGGTRKTNRCEHSCAPSAVFFFLEDRTSKLHGPRAGISSRVRTRVSKDQILRTNRGLAQMLPMVRTRPQVDCQSAAVHAIVYLKTPRETLGTCQ